MTVLETWPMRDPEGFWSFLRDHHDRKAADGLTDAPEVHEDLAWNAQRQLNALTHPQTQKERA